ncbi:MAG TPA: glycosyltransferase family A protein, partial [Rhodopila sp.]
MSGALMPPDIIDPNLLHLTRAMVDTDWYRARYPDIAGAGLDPAEHFVRFGAAENRDPNRFFDSAWYLEHYSDVAFSDFNAIQHYLLAGAAELRNPHPRFDAHFYVDQHPDAADNPLLYHLRTGLSRGYLTEKPIDISDYLPTQSATAPEPCAPVDVVVPVLHGLAATRRCLLSVLADRTPPLVRITVIADATAKPDVLTWLQRLAANGEIYLIHSRRKLGHAASVNLGITAAGTHDVAILHSNTKVSAGWLRRLGAVAWSNEHTACVSPLSDTTAPSFGVPQTAMDKVCRMVNAG